MGSVNLGYVTSASLCCHSAVAKPTAAYISAVVTAAENEDAAGLGTFSLG